MFMFTLVQSRTHADIVLVVLKDCINSIDICCYHTMKVAGCSVRKDHM